MDVHGDETQAQGRGPFTRLRGAITYLKAHRKRLFWWWITYQTVKGLVTLSLIWIPLFILWVRGG
jgi:hypothetical protein